MKKSHQQRHKRTSQKSPFIRAISWVCEVMNFEAQVVFTHTPPKPLWQMPYIHGGDLWQQTCIFKETPAARIGVGNAKARLAEKRKRNAKIYG